jgi:hypothetical protein
VDGWGAWLPLVSWDLVSGLDEESEGVEGGGSLGFVPHVKDLPTDGSVLEGKQYPVCKNQPLDS